MVRIAGGLSGAALSTQRQILRAFQGIDTASLRLAAMQRINRGSDDPAGLMALESLRNELNSLQEASDAAGRAHALVQTADSALGQVNDLLVEIRSHVVAAANTATSPAEQSALQVAIDVALNSLDLIGISTRFGGRQLLDNSSALDVSGVNQLQIADVQVFFTAAAPSTVLDIFVHEKARQAQLTGGTGPLAEATTLLVSGNQGSVTLDFAAGAALEDVAAAVNATADATGVEAQVSGGQLTLSSVEVGSDAVVSVEVLSGSFDVGAGQASGSDARASVNGTEVVGEGDVIRVRTAALEADLTLASGFSGPADPITITGEGLHVLVGPEPFHVAQLVLPHVHSGALGGAAGRLSELRSGRAASLASGHLRRSLQIIDAAQRQVLEGRARAGTFQRQTLDTAQAVYAATSINLSRAASQIGDTDVALESARLVRSLIQRDFALAAARTHHRHRGLVSQLLR